MSLVRVVFELDALQMKMEMKMIISKWHSSGRIEVSPRGGRRWVRMLTGRSAASAAPKGR